MGDCLAGSNTTIDAYVESGNGSVIFLQQGDDTQLKIANGIKLRLAKLKIVNYVPTLND